MSDQPVISIVIPVYNANKYIAKTLKSVLLQTNNSWECIIINDGSKDNSEDIILSFIGDDNRFKYIYQDNTGVCIARNNAVKEAKGEFVLFIDGDDLISDNFLEETLKIFEHNPEVTVVTSTVKFFGQIEAVFTVTSYDVPTLLAENQMVVTCLFRLEDFKRVGGFNVNMKDGFEDWDFWISILKNGGSVICAEKAIFYYRSLVKSRNLAITNDMEKVLRLQMWNNHKEVFSKYFLDPTKTFEYKRIANSKEYKIGFIILRPVRKIFYWYAYIKEKFFITEI